jgi:hypothetical protein
MAEREVPVVHALIRPISMARIQTVDWDELRDLADKGDKGDKGKCIDPECPRCQTGDAYARGVQDALRWLADGVPTTALLQLLGGR